jgi:hypothetical protein
MHGLKGGLRKPSRNAAAPEAYQYGGVSGTIRMCEPGTCVKWKYQKHSMFMRVSWRQNVLGLERTRTHPALGPLDVIHVDENARDKIFAEARSYGLIPLSR